MSEKRFDVKKLDKLNNPKRLEILPATYIIEKAGIGEDSIIVDIGAGTGFYSKELANLCKGSTVFACDISKVMVDWMNENLLESYANIIPMRMDDSQVLLKSKMADFVVMVNLHHELDYPDKTLKEASRLLKPGGKIAVSDWKKGGANMGPSMDIRVETSDLKLQMKDAGFSSVEVYEDLSENFLVVGSKE